MARKPAKKSPPKKKAPARAKKITPPRKKPAAPVKKRVVSKPSPAQEKLRELVKSALEDAKAQDILCVDVRGESTLADFLFIASGQSSRQVAGIVDRLKKALGGTGLRNMRIEGLPQGDWAVVDAGDVIVHLFRPEVRNYYRLEEVWGLEPPLQETFKNL